MAIEMEEDYLGRSGTATERRLRFLVRGSDEDSEVRAYVQDNVPGVHDGLVARAISSMQQQSDQIWRVTVDYGALSLFDVPDFSPGTASYTFDVQVEPETFFFSVNRISRSPANAPQILNGMVGYQLGEDSAVHAGVTVPAGPVTDVVTYEYPSAVIPSSYRNTVRSLIGAANSSIFLGGPPGTMRFVACSASVTSTGKQTITFRFSYRPVREVTIGALSLGNVDGWDSVWAVTETVTVPDEDGKETPFQEPVYAYRERFVPRLDFAGLGLPAL